MVMDKETEQQVMDKTLEELQLKEIEAMENYASRLQGAVDKLNRLVEYSSLISREW